MKEELQKKITDVKNNSPETVDSIKNLMGKFEEINAKNNCIRVRFYDWFAEYLETLAKKMRDRAFKITTPCAIQLPPQKPVKKKPVAETVINREPGVPFGMKLPDEQVKQMVPDLSPEIQEAIANVAKAEEEHAKKVAKEKK